MNARPRSLMPQLLMIGLACGIAPVGAADTAAAERPSSTAPAAARVKPEAVKLQPRTDLRIPATTTCVNCPDLVPGNCLIECAIGSQVDAAICASDGYKSSFGFRVSLRPGVRNGGAVAATLPAGKRLYVSSGAASGNAAAPSTGLFIDAGAVAPQVPRVQLDALAAGDHVIRFEVDPDLAVTERDETNNAIDCRLTVIDAASAAKQADLLLDPIQVFPPSGSQETAFKVLVNVRNQGTGYSSPFTVACSPGVTNRHHTLAPGSETLLGGAVQNVASLPPGTHTVICTLTTDQPEQSQVQHTRTATLTVQ